MSSRYFLRASLFCFAIGILGTIWLIPSVMAYPPSPCIVPDNGLVTVDLPAPCPYIAVGGGMAIIDGLPPGTTIDVDPVLDQFTSIVRTPGGTLSGEIIQADAIFTMTMTGTGVLAGFSRTIMMPVTVEIHTAPHTPGDPVQAFQMELINMSGTILGDPDFDQLTISGNSTSNGTPDSTKLTLRPDGDFSVDSFFDITYQVDYNGAPGGPIDGLSGSTIGSVRLQQGANYWQPGDDFKMHYPQLPDEAGWDVNATFPVVLGDDWQCSETGWVKDLHFWGSWFGGQTGVIDSFDIRVYSDVPAGQNTPSHPGQLLWKWSVANFSQLAIDPQTQEGWYDPSSTQFFVNDHQQYFQYDILLDSADWFMQTQGTIYWLSITAHLADPVNTSWGWKSSIDHFNDDAVWGQILGDPCISPDDGNNGPVLPAQCSFQMIHDSMFIFDGLPAGSAINIVEPYFDRFTNITRIPGGSLGGEILQFDAIITLPMFGIGGLLGFNRFIEMPITVEMHIASMPSDPFRTFDAVLYSMQGSILGDPDFDQLILIAGTGNGLPSPGTVFTKLNDGGDWNVDSFFDITYEISFVGAPGSIIGGLSGTTTATVEAIQGQLVLDPWIEMYEPPTFVQSMDLSFVITGGPAGCCVGQRGDVNGDGSIDIVDLTCIVDFLFGTGCVMPCFEEADINGDGSIDIVDLTCIVDYLFGIPGPGCPAQCP